MVEEDAPKETLSLLLLRHSQLEITEISSLLHQRAFSIGPRIAIWTPQPISFLSVWDETRKPQQKAALKTPERQEEDQQEVTVILAAAKQVSVDAGLATAAMEQGLSN